MNKIKALILTLFVFVPARTCLAKVVSRRQGNDGPPFEQNPILTPAKSADATLPIFPPVPALQSEFYYYHYNHQGSVAVVSDMTGRMQQHLHYLPYGGLFVDQRRSSSTTPSRYTFSAKEKDSETGYTYFGARYYSDNLMQWLSVDPMSDKRPWSSPYSYCQNNPIGRIDELGMLDDEWEINRAGEIVKHIETSKHDAFYMVDNDGNRIEDKSISFKYGTVEKFRTQTYAQHDNNVATYDGGTHNKHKKDHK